MPFPRRGWGSPSRWGSGRSAERRSPTAGGAGARDAISCRPSAQDRPLRRRPAGGAGFRGSALGEGGNSNAGVAGVRVSY
jgi:hypothetical protein